MKHLFLLLLLLIFMVFIAQSQSCNTSGIPSRETYASGLLGQTMYYSVYLPPCYDASANPYPVIYLMHGSNDDDGHWNRLGITEVLDEAIGNGEMPPLVVVMPFGNLIANRNIFDNYSWANIFLTELMPDAESKFNLSTEQSFRAIGGISRGGFWAYQIAFSHPELFSSVGGHSAFFDRYHAEAAFNPLDLALNQTGIENLRLWLDRGHDDFAAEGLDLMAERLTERGLSYEYQIYPEGEHNNAYWSQHIAAYLQFYTEAWLNPPVLATASPSAVNAFATNTPIAPIASPSTISTEEKLFLPVAAFPSLQSSVSLSNLEAIANGELNLSLILDSETATDLALRFPLNPNLQIVEPNALPNTLWQNRNLFTLLPLEKINPRLRILFVDDMPFSDIPTYPFAGNSDSLSRITLSGVSALTRNTRLALDENGLEWAAEAIRPYVISADLFHISNEVSFVETCPQSPNGIYLGGASSFCSNPAHFELFNMLDVDLVELTGNHNNDYGYEAYQATFNFYRDNQIATVGGGETIAEAQSAYQTTINGNNIAFLACNAVGPYYALVNEDENMLGGLRAGATPCDWDWLEEALANLAIEAEVVIVSVQYLEVEDYLPTQQQMIDFRRLADLGADVVIGSQAHKPQTFEFYQTSRGELAFIHYGLGNLFFDQPFWGNQRFFLDTLYISDGQLRGIELYTGIIEDLARPRLMTTEERENFLFFMFNEQNGF